MSSRRNAFVTVLFSFMLVIFAFQNCDKPIQNEEENQSGDSGGGGGEIVFERPDEICGQAGFEFLVEAYLGEHCAFCHNDGGFSEPKFLVADKDAAYVASLAISNEVWEETITNNAFCGVTGCNLSEDDPRYIAIHEWLNAKMDSDCSE